MATRPQARDAVGKAFKIALGCLGFAIAATAGLVIFLLNSETVRDFLDELFDSVVIEATEGDPGGGESPSQADPLGESEGEVSSVDIYQGFRGTLNLEEAEGRDEALALMVNLAEGASEAGIPHSAIREVLKGLALGNSTWAADADWLADEAMAALTGFDTPVPEAGVEGGGLEENPEEPGEDPDALGPMALDSIAVLNQELREAEETQEELEQALERTNEVLQVEQDRSLLDWILGFIDDLGIGFGWAAIYLTVTHAWWKGTSIGKKFFRIRVVMIDKRPLNWWLSFERTGGYAAGFATGLLGFAQIFWDPNRQAIHDKVSETIVIQDGKDPVSGPWIEEGKAQWSRGRKAT
jgi:hypothetical protein